MKCARTTFLVIVGSLCVLTQVASSQEEDLKGKQLSTSRQTTQDGTVSANQYVRVVLKGGRVLTGVLLSETEENLQLRSDTGTLYTIARDQISVIEKSSTQFGDAKIPLTKSTTQQLGGAEANLTNAYPSSRGSLMFDAQLVYSSISPDKGDALSSFSLALNGYTFVVRGVGLGVTLGSSSIDVSGKAGGTESTFFIGPKVLFALGTAKSSVYPYLHAAYQSYTATVKPKIGSSVSASASSVKLGLGFLFRSFQHVGTPLEFAAEFRQFDQVKQTVYTISFGISGFLYELF
jgi:hypothetical protein